MISIALIVVAAIRWALGAPLTAWEWTLGAFLLGGNIGLWAGRRTPDRLFVCPYCGKKHDANPLGVYHGVQYW